MKQRIEVRSQAEFDACVAKGNIAIVIGCSVEAWGNSSVVAWDNSSVVAWDNSSVEARGNSSVVAWDNSSVEARGNSSVVAWDNSSVEAWGNSSVEARGNSSVEAWGNSSVVAWDNSSVEARGNSSVEARGNSSVVARGNSSVEAWGNVFVRFFSALKIKASLTVVVMLHAESRAVEGGQQIVAAKEPKIGKEWGEFNGIEPEKVNYRVEAIDVKIFDLIEKEKIQFDMGSWHDVKCDETNWCNTSHCRAGFAICLAGAEGFALEKKYGAELAGRMIYAVSRPDEELPDFFCSTEEALEDIKFHAAKQIAATGKGE